MLYVNYIDGVNLYGCLFYIDILEDLKSLAPLISVFGVDDNNGDFGSIFYDYYGNVGPLQTSNMFFTLVNTTGTTSIEAILKGQQNVTASITPGERPLRGCPFPHLLTSSPPHLPLQSLETGFSTERQPVSRPFRGSSPGLWSFSVSPFYFQGFHVSNVVIMYACCGGYCLLKALALTIDPYNLFNRIPYWGYTLLAYWGYWSGYVAYVLIGVSW